ncbi:MAG: flagellar basal body rod C-terminal domain-containing protein [Candidatus Sericytochromatia bacterium]|nr:flagellar basal body rod C-terminal domain-containing protein [Candidatus Sericytochromatia bacterium]
MTSQIHTAVFNTIGAVDQWMKVIGNNVTGSVVTGFKGSKLEFGEVLNQQMRGSARASDGYGSVNAIQRADSGVYVKGTSTDFRQGSIVQTANPLNLAIDGDAFFVLSRRPVPTTIEDLVFTRDGDFNMEFIRGDLPGTGTWRLVNKEGMFVMGYNTPVDPNVRPLGVPPEENQGTDLSAFTTVATNGANAPLNVGLQGLQLDLVRNPDAAGNLSFDSRGLLMLNGGAPRDLANNEANVHVALAKFANTQGLIRDAGGAYFRYHDVAGQIFSGTAGNDTQGRVVGGSNQLRAGALENSNTSINTTLPEITLAQKSFSATSKLISVGNTIIDDVNNLIR